MNNNFIKKLIAHPFLAEAKLNIIKTLLLNDFLPQSVKKHFRKIIYYLPRSKILTTIKITSGLQAIFNLDLQSYGDRNIFYGDYEKATVQFYKQILNTKKVVWDIGSNIGFYVVLACILLKGKGEVFAFEPVPLNFNALKKNVNLNCLTNVTLSNVALSSENGLAEIYLIDRHKVTSTPTLNEGWARSSGLIESIVINTRNPMDLLKKDEIKKPDLIKIDAETHEPVIFETIKSLLVINKAPDIISELMPPTIEPLKRLLIEQCGYSCYHITPEGIRRIKELKMRRPYNDYFFTKSINSLDKIEYLNAE